MEGLSLGLAQRLFGCGDVFDDLCLEGFEVGESPLRTQKADQLHAEIFPVQIALEPQQVR